MSNKHPFKAALLLLLLIAALLAFAACGYRNGRVAGAEREIVHAYIVNINEQARTITFDEVELLTENDQRSTDLGIVHSDFRNGYYAHNASHAQRMLPLAQNVDFDFTLADEYNASRSSLYTRDNMSGTNDGVSYNGMNADSFYNYNAGNATSNATRDTARDGVIGINTADGYSEGVYDNGLNDSVNGAQDGTLFSSQARRIMSGINTNAETLYTLTIENGVVVRIEESSYLFGYNYNGIS